jgi:hypothetical protein
MLIGPQCASRKVASLEYERGLGSAVDRPVGGLPAKGSCLDKVTNFDLSLRRGSICVDCRTIDRGLRLAKAASCQRQLPAPVGQTTTIRLRSAAEDCRIRHGHRNSLLTRDCAARLDAAEVREKRVLHMSTFCYHQSRRRICDGVTARHGDADKHR